MKKMMLVVTLYVFSFMSQASYSCNDREYLKNILAQLNQSCGGSVVCSAKGFKASTIEGAIEACRKVYSEYSCNQSARCD